MKKYKVIGVQPVVVDGVTHLPGKTFEAKMDDQFLVGIGALKVIAPKKK